MKAFLIEDDPIFRKDLGDMLRSKFPALDIENIECVSDFERHFEAFATAPPNFVVLDIMIPWSKHESVSGSGSEMPAEFDPFRAGLSILQLMSDDPRTYRVPIVILSAAFESVLLEGAILPSHVIGLMKPTAPARIIECIKALTFGQLTDSRAPLHVRLADAIEAKPGWFGFTFDLRKLLQR